MDGCKTLQAYIFLCTWALQALAHESFLHLASRSHHHWATNRKPPKDLDLDMVSHVSNAILSLTRSVLWMRKMFIESLSMQWKRWNRGNGSYGFSYGKNSIFSYKGLASISSLFSHFLGLFNPYLRPFAKPHSCVCAGKWTVDRYNIEYGDARLHSHPKYLPDGSCGQAR